MSGRGEDCACSSLAVETVSRLVTLVAFFIPTVTVTVRQKEKEKEEGKDSTQARGLVRRVKEKIKTRLSKVRLIIETHLWTLLADCGVA